MKKILFFLILAIGLSAGEVIISNAFAKQTMNLKNGAVFFDMNNIANEDVKLISATSSVCSSVELHTHKMQDGMMSMIQVKDIIIPKKSKVSLKRGGLHIMLIGLKEQLKAGQSIDLKLKFDDGNIIVLDKIAVNNGQKH